MARLLWVVAAAGCAAEISDGAAIGACASDKDCPSGTTCYGRRLCVVMPEEAATIYLQMTPPAASGLVAEQFKSVVGGADHVSPVTWSLTPPASIFGTVARGSINTSVPGTLLAVTSGALVGTTLTYKAGSEAAKEFPESGLADRSFGFRLRLQLAHTYDVLFWPKEPTIPPYYATRFVGGLTDIWEVTLPGEAADGEQGKVKSLVTVAGRFVSAPVPAPDCAKGPGPPSDACELPGCHGVEGLRVRLSDKAGRTRSTMAVTNAEGRFEITVDPAAGEVWLRFGPDAQGAALPSGRWAEPVDLGAVGVSGGGVRDLGVLALGVLPSLTTIEPTVRSVSGAPVKGARVKIVRPVLPPQRCVPSGEGWKAAPAIADMRYAYNVVTDEQGRVVAPLLPSPEARSKVTWGHAISVPAGWGTVTLLPVPLDSAGLRSQQMKLETLSTLTCPERPMIHGTVVDHGGRAVGGAEVVFRPLPGGGAPSCLGVVGELGSLPTSPIIVQVDGEGAYAARLDPGRYAVTVRPPEDSGLARALVEVIEVCPPADKEPRELPMSRVDLELPPPTVLAGRVLGPDHKPAVGVRMEVLAGQLAKLQQATVVAGAGDGPMDPALVRDTHVIGDGMTDAKGRYEILIAPGQLVPDE